MRIHSFSDAEGVKIAIEMERRGEAFYRRAARISRNPETVRMLEQLAGEERVHSAEFEKLGARSGIGQEAYDAETNAYLSAIAGDIVFSEGLMALRHTGFDSPEGALLEAIQSEKDSILFYTELARMARGDEARAVFEEIIRQEKGHMRLLQMRLATITED